MVCKRLFTNLGQGHNGHKDEALPLYRQQQRSFLLAPATRFRLFCADFLNPFDGVFDLLMNQYNRVELIKRRSEYSPNGFEVGIEIR